MVKQSKAFGSARPTSSESTIKDNTPSIASSNFRAIFKEHLSYNDAIRLMIKFLPKHPMFGAFNAFTKAVPMVVLFKCAFSTLHASINLQEVHLNLVDDSLVVLTKQNFLNSINHMVLPSTRFYSPSPNDMVSTLYQMGY